MVGLLVLCRKSFSRLYSLPALVMQLYATCSHLFAEFHADDHILEQPFISLWKPTVLWKGLIFALLMAFAKIAVGLYVVLWSTLSTSGVNVRRSLATLSKRTLRLHPISEHKSVHQIRTPGSTSGETTALENCPSSRSHHPIRSSIPAAAFMGVGMISRGEIGLLIAQIARNGTGTSDGEQAGLLGDEAFSVCIWAIMLCTLVGPIGVGFVVRRWENRIRQGMWG